MRKAPFAIQRRQIPFQKCIRSLMGAAVVSEAVMAGVKLPRSYGSQTHAVHSGERKARDDWRKRMFYVNPLSPSYMWSALSFRARRFSSKSFQSAGRVQKPLNQLTPLAE